MLEIYCNSMEADDSIVAERAGHQRHSFEAARRPSPVTLEFPCTAWTRVIIVFRKYALYYPDRIFVPSIGYSIDPCC